MKVLIVLAALVAASYALLSNASIKRQWEEFKGTHTKTYASPIEEAHRMKIFKENIDRISKHNARFDKGEVTFKVGVNKFADMYTHEVAEKLNGFRMESFGLVKKGNQVHKKFNLRWPWSKNVDWRSKGYVTPVKDQGKCSAGWAFSATGALEGQLFKKYGQLVPLSAQNLVDCSYGDNNGCNGRRIDEAFAYVRYNLGIDTEKGYPYTGKLGTCSYTLVHKGGTATGYVDVNPTEDDLKDAVATVGPVSAVIDASNWSFQMYASGIYYEPQCSSNNVTHGVLVVGFGSGWLNNDYWIVKNSMGTSWGEEGYIRMARNKNNNCGIATQAGYPTV